METDESGWPRDLQAHVSDLGKIRELLDAGADPDAEVDYGCNRPLHLAAEHGSPEVVAELAGRVRDIDAEDHGRSALWVAVCHRRPDVARVLVEAGADPWRPMMGGWSPGRLSLAGPTPDLFDVPEDEPGLTAEETAMVASAPRLNAIFADDEETDYFGMGLACVADVDAEQAVRRLDGIPVDADEVDLEEEAENVPSSIVAVTDVPGGCVVAQPWGPMPVANGVVGRLSAGTIAYGLYDNPKSGDQGILAEDGTIVGWDLYPGTPGAGVTARDVLAAFLTADNPFAHCFVHAGLNPVDDRSLAGPPDLWIRLPERGWRAWPYSSPWRSFPP